MTLPQGWVETTLGEIGNWGSGGTPKAGHSEFYSGGIPWIRSGDLPGGPIVLHEATISEAGLLNSSAKWVEADSVLIAMYGATIGKVGITTYPVTTNQAVAFFRPLKGIFPNFIFQALRSRRDEFVRLGQGGAQPNISQEIIKAQKILLPPTDEQRRIVAKLGALIGDLACLRGELERVPTLAAKLRQAVLTEARSTVGDAPRVSVNELSTTTFDGPFGSNLKSADYSSDGVRVVRLENIGHLQFNADRKTYIPEEKYVQLTRHTLQSGDILFSSFVDQQVRVCRLPEDVGLAINKADCFAVRVSEDSVDGRFVTYMLASTETYGAMKVKVHGATRPRIGLSQLREYKLPLPALQDQRRIADQLDTAFARADRLEAEAARALALLDRLEAAILAKAFRGELVPQDPNDEPASVLLDRIRAERAAAPKPKRGRARKTVG
jgi:type I restriction enzyme S subunit